MREVQKRHCTISVLRLKKGLLYMPMFKAIEKIALTSGQYSFEERMGCGFGACMGCSMMMADGSYKRVCKEGPVFRREEILWK